jgi:glucose-1-phosphate cytidylyltransferase
MNTAPTLSERSALSNVTAVILAGGLGTRVREETEFKPKPMIEIGKKPILWHIMKHLSSFGIQDFVICVGYKGDVIRDYFLNYRSRNSNFMVDLSVQSSTKVTFFNNPSEEWKVKVIETGDLTPTGGRLSIVKEYVDSDDFFCTYGDGVSDINLLELHRHHLREGRLATLTAVRGQSRYGILGLRGHQVTKFAEKPDEGGWINGGFFFFQRAVFDYLDSSCVLEADVLPVLASENQLSAYLHHGYWQSMDTYREVQLLNNLLSQGVAPWNH